MDRSFLSHTDVIEASRRFVCVRLTTYEVKNEHDFLRTLMVGRSGQVENTTFTILAPDGKRTLVRPSRSTKAVFPNATQMASAMNRIAPQFDAIEASKQTAAPLPAVASVRLALNVAAGDNLPLVVLFAPEESGRRKLSEQLRVLAWSEPFIGRFTYVESSDVKDLAAIKDAGVEPGILIVAPSKFGDSGTILARATANAPKARLAIALNDGLSRFTKFDKTFANHVRAGQQQGVFWETALPVSDPQEAQARERGRKLSSKR